MNDKEIQRNVQATLSDFNERFTPAKASKTEYLEAIGQLIGELQMQEEAVQEELKDDTALEE